VGFPAQVCAYSFSFLWGLLAENPATTVVVEKSG